MNRVLTRREIVLVALLNNPQGLKYEELKKEINGVVDEDLFHTLLSGLERNRLIKRIGGRYYHGTRATQIKFTAIHKEKRYQNKKEWFTTIRRQVRKGYEQKMKALAVLAEEAGEHESAVLHAVMNDLRAVLSVEIPGRS